MTEPNVNTFAPDVNVKSTFTSLPTFSGKDSIAVIGAGAFGGWTALFLLRKGFNVTLIDTWGAGNSRSSSGDETRVIRSTYGNNKLYFDLNVEALRLWKENELSFGKKLFYNRGVLWFCYQESTPLVDDSIAFADEHHMSYQKLTVEDLKKRYPIVNTTDLHHAYYDPYGGYLKAREACAAVLEAFIKEGGKYVQQQIVSPKIEKRHLSFVTTANGDTVNASVFIFACGSWLPEIFPLLKDEITCTKQEVYYFGVPQDASVVHDNFPVWIDVDGKDFYYGIAGNAARGFKIGVDKRGENFDPTNGERRLEPSVLEDARKFLRRRFPSLANAPLIENRVCPYENSRTGNFIFDLHPGSDNVFFLGGGSGHGFKHGPALGKLIASALRGEAKVPDLFRLPR
jgi:glycine/D-amino acid oxidase-like deaminating enzyme